MILFRQVCGLVLNLVRLPLPLYDRWKEKCRFEPNNFKQIIKTKREMDTYC